MKKFDILTPIGIGLGIFMVLFAVFNGGGQVTTFIDVASMLVVFGGLAGALLISFNLTELKMIPKVGKEAFNQNEHDVKGLIDTFVNLADKARREGLLALEAELDNIEDKFIKKGILLAVDGMEPEVINDIMTAEIAAMEERHRKGRGLFEKMGEYAPAWGMIGTLVGLVLMLKNLNDPSTLGPKMAVALITTFYGSLLANLVFIPIASKLGAKSEQEVFVKQIAIEGVIGVQSGQNPKILQEKLSAFLPAAARTSEDEEEAGEVNEA